MRLCLCSPHFPPDLSGMGDYTYFLANALAAIGCEVQVLTSIGGLDSTLYPSAEGVLVHRVVKAWSVRELPHILRAIRGLECDVFVIQYTPHAYDQRGITLGVNLLPLLLRFMTRARVMLNFHELYIPFTLSLKHCVGALWQRAMAFLIAAPSHVLTAISSEWPRRLRRIGVWKHIQVVPVGSNVPRARVSPEEVQAIRERLGVDRSTLLIGSFGSAGPDRDVELLLAGVEKLQREHSLKLVWLGMSGIQPMGRAGSPKASEAAVDIVWTGPRPHPEISRTMAACDLFVLPFKDGVSTKRGTLAAALLHELPIIATRGERLDDIFVHRHNIYLIPLVGVGALSEGLSELARWPELRTRLSRGARTLHDERFAWNVIAREVVRLADSALAL
jgi:glycosyltransferase involved in cell wall biosynthesis